MTTKNQTLKRTPLYGIHQELGARMVEFGGWDMPVQYSSILDEHKAVRHAAGLFDISHMGEFKISGPEALTTIQKLVPNDVSKLTINRALYTQFCQPDGGVIDDLVVYRLGEDLYMLVVNATNTDGDFAWVQPHSPPGVKLENVSAETGLLALQGPQAQAVLQPLTETDLSLIKYYHCISGTVAGKSCLISRTGYTGEDGFELYCQAEDTSALWQALLAAGKEVGVLPAGLGARDTLRLEAAFPLYGHELDTTINPLQAGLGWTVKLEKGDFIGREALEQVKAHGLTKKLVGLELTGRGIARAGYSIFADASGEQVGTLTSGTISPLLNKPIALGYVTIEHSHPGTKLAVEIRGNKISALVVPTPFYKRAK